MRWPFGKPVTLQMCNSYLQLGAWVPAAQTDFTAAHVDENVAFQPGFLLQVSVRRLTPSLILQFHFPGLLRIS